nr:GNAT family N-acetyltransferase [Frigidibacter sp. SD6-1]
MRTPRRMRPDEDFGPVLALIRSAFAYMDVRIDPPSSVHRLTADAMALRAATEEIWVLEDLGQPVASIILTPKADHLYLGKLAVAQDYRGQGLARQLVRHAATRAKALALPELRLQTRVELQENHRAFGAMGFTETGRSAHPGYDRPTSISFTLRV